MKERSDLPPYLNCQKDMNLGVYDNIEFCGKCGKYKHLGNCEFVKIECGCCEYVQWIEWAELKKKMGEI